MSPQPHPRSHVTIGQVMGWIAAIAVAWALAVTPGSARFVVWVLVPMALVIAGPILVIHHIMDRSIGIRCPYCGGGESMERRAVASFGSRFYRCNACGVRCRRGAFGNWEDASGPEFDARFRKKGEGDPWSGPPGLEDEDLIYSKTHGNLVRNKRLRRPDNPNGPGLE